MGDLRRLPITFLESFPGSIQVPCQGWGACHEGRGDEVKGSFPRNFLLEVFDLT